MATETASTVNERPADARRETAARSGYFFWTSVLLLVLVLIGFAPTLYLRPFFDTPPIPFYLYVHGAVLTLWFAWFAQQTALVRTGRTARHRQMGWFGAVIAAVVVIAGPLATFGVVPRMLALGVSLDSDMRSIPVIGVEGITVLQFLTPIVWGNLLGIITFAGLVLSAILLRRRSEHHKRLMLIASLGLIGPPLARISRWPVFGGEDGLFLPVFGLSLMFSVLAYDLIARRKPHPATLAGIGVTIVAVIVTNAIATSKFGQDFVRSLA